MIQSHPQSPRLVSNGLILALQEVTKPFKNTKGLIGLAAFAIVWFLLLRYPIAQAVDFIDNPMFSDLIEKMSASYRIDHIIAWPTAELAVYWIAAFYIFPFFCIVMTADQTVTDRVRGTLRFLSLRSSRMSIFLGRFFGRWLQMSALMALTVLATVIVAIFNSGASGGMLMLMVVIIVNLAIYIAPYVALMSLFSVITKSARMTMLAPLFLWIAVGLINFVLSRWIGAYADWSFLLPGSQVEMLLRLDGWQTLQVAWWPLTQTAGYLALGAFIFRRQML